MPFWTYRDFAVKLNNNEVFCDDASISYNANISPNYLIGDRYSFDYRPTDGILGNLQMNYYLTGADFLKGYTTNETAVLSGNFGGLHFNSGYLSQYTINGNPNAPVLVRANVVFFEPLKGTFTGSVPHNTGLPILNCADITLDNRPTYSIDNPLVITSFAYNFNSEITPVYFIASGTGLQDLSPNRISFGPKTIQGEITCDSMSGNIPLLGQNQALIITFTHPELPTLSESIAISGKLFQRTMSTKAGEVLQTAISIKQNFIDDPPIISSVSLT